MNSNQNLPNDPQTYPNRTVPDRTASNHTAGSPEPFAAAIDPLQSSQVRTDAREEVLQLLEERVVVDRSKRKVGEVIVRKEVETYMVQVPVRRERLIVEQVGAVNKQLASIDLSQGELSAVELSSGDLGSGELSNSDLSNGDLSNGELGNRAIANSVAQPTSSMVTVSFSSIEAAHQALAELAAQSSHDQPTRIDISLPSSEALRYQNWISRSRH